MFAAFVFLLVAVFASRPGQANINYMNHMDRSVFVVYAHDILHTESATRIPGLGWVIYSYLIRRKIIIIYYIMLFYFNNKGSSRKAVVMSVTKNV